ncbi:MAG: glycosyltransferase [Clostridia bacterium]|nr:glycosyltransferase [Clostridia bacterium]
MNKPLISVIMPCYQNAQSLAASVRSVQAQTEPRWELIAVNDGSTDDTGAVLEQLAGGEPRMRVITQENGGVSRARNAGIAAAKGEWLFFLDADDLLTEDALAHLLSMTGDGMDIVCAAYAMRYIDEGGREEIHTCADGDLISILESLIRGDSALNSMCARLYRAEMIREHRILTPPGVRVGEDVLFNLDAFRAARAWRISDQVIYIYEFGGDSAMTRARTDRYLRSKDMLEGIGRFLDESGLQTQLFRAHIDVYLRTLRVDRGRFRAALAFDRCIVRRICRGVDFGALCAKQKIYYAALTLLPFSSIMLP